MFVYFLQGHSGGWRGKDAAGTPVCVCVCVCVCAAFPPRKTTPVEHDLLISVFLVVAYVHKMFYRRLYKQMHPTQEAFWLRHHGVGEVP